MTFLADVLYELGTVSLDHALAKWAIMLSLGILLVFFVALNEKKQIVATMRGCFDEVRTLGITVPASRIKTSARQNNERCGPGNCVPMPHRSVRKRCFASRLCSIGLGVEARRSGQRGKQGRGLMSGGNELARRLADLLRAVGASHLGKPALDRDGL